MTVAVLLWAAACFCLWMLLVDDGGIGYLVGYAALQGAAIASSVRAAPAVGSLELFSMSP
jgi:hypothetical protein